MGNSENLIEKIRKGKYKPLPRWHFSLKNLIALLMFLFAIGFGSLAFSIILFAIQQIDFNLVQHMSHSWIEFVLVLVPFFWIACLVILLFISFFSFRKLKKGYKFKTLVLIGYCTALSISFGTIFFISGGAKWLENCFADKINMYEGVMDKKIKIWSAPEKGNLSGTVETVDDSTLTLIDFNLRKWTVDFHDADIITFRGIVAGEKIKIIGMMTSHDSFVAEKIRPWGSE